ncbi:hypothetical protein [Calidifontibacillus erzurumensis]|uniref:hypothetical protein n=1 Tax=Calidifontibacillus erzurumensis TaxID=2741433 RepID=UPI0035B50AE4
MPAISKIRLTNVVYEYGQKRYHDEIFLFDGHNGAIVLENGGGKSVFIQTVLQAVFPHAEVGERKTKDTITLDEGPAHIAIEWLLNEKPRRYAVTAVTLFKKSNGIDSLRYVYEYGENDPHSIEKIPFVQGEGKEKRPSSRGEMADYYSYMANQYSRNAKTFPQSIKSYREYIEKSFHIIAGEWESIIRINGAEGDVEAFFENCKKTNELIDRLLIPSVEKGIAGFHKDVFVDMFENRRDQFKKYKELKETINQNKRLSKELQAYVNQFQKVDETEKEYTYARRKAKGYQTYIVEELEHITSNLEKIEIAFEEWHEQNRSLSMKKDSLTIRKEQQKLKDLQEKANAIWQRLVELEDLLQKNTHEYYSLQFAGAREEILKEQENIEWFERELQKVDQDSDIEDVVIQLEKVNGQLHYLFLELKENIEKQIREAKYEFNQLADQQDGLKEKHQKLQQDKEQWKERLIKTQALADSYVKQMKSLKSELVSHEDESINYLLSQWSEKLQTLDEEKVAIVQQIKEFEPRLAELKVRRKQLEHQLLENQANLKGLEEKKNQFDFQHKKILSIITEIMPHRSFIDSVYNRQSSIENQLEERISKLKRQKEKLMEEERQAKRFVDDYLEQDQFFADPYVEKKIQQWNQFEYLKTGIQYLQSIGNEFLIDQNNYPFWALTIITTEKDKKDVREKIKSIQHQLQYPIFILSTKEAEQLVKGESSYEEVVEPAIWQMNIDQKRFSEWKEHIAQEAERKTLNRLEVEQTLQTWERTAEQFRQFLQDYPHEKYTMITDEIQSLSHHIQNLQEEQKKLEEKLIELEKELKLKRNAVHTMELEIQDLQNRLIPNAIKYINLEKEHRELQKQITEFNQQINNLVEQEKSLVSQLDYINQELNSKENEIKNLEFQLKLEIDRNELYKAVKEYRIVQTSSPMETIKLQQKQLNDQINQIHTTRREWQNRIENSKQRINDLRKLQTRWKNEWESLDENYPFPINGDEKINQLAKRMNELKKEVEKASEHASSAITDVRVQESQVNQRILLYQQHYSNEEIFSFPEDLAVVEEQLEEEQTALQRQLEYLKQQKTLFEKEKTSYDALKQKFDRHELVHKLDDPNLERAILTDEEKQEFPYKRQAIVDQLIYELELKQRAVLTEKNRLEQAKEIFKRFCNELADPKMRKNAIEGVESKKTYEEVLKYQQQLEERIARTIQIAEVTIQDYDKEQQQFITYIHTHLQKVREDLLEIQKKTRVRVEDDWKTIYQIQVPDWDEDEAKEKIREHIDWILSQIERDTFQDEHGQEDAAKVRQFLEKTLQTVPLLREVIGNQTIKVRCRKVESDQHISNNYFTWEQSNQWSGGEKWSKNMALFLGLLNFIAEKSYNPQSNAKRHRTVILDNPFGKASSDHVLNPVFFIAEQLGFQIIALTAHAEGKFLSDYFPIIYSCKLRHLEGGTKQVLTKEKQLKYAYFQDHAPESLERLGERQQMSLFD